jgi:hypothetical protein
MGLQIKELKYYTSLQEKTIFQFKNTLERKKQSYELRIKNDNQSLEYLKQQRL